jgi:hypothetical protein
MNKRRRVAFKKRRRTRERLKAKARQARQAATPAAPTRRGGAQSA